MTPATGQDQDQLARIESMVHSDPEIMRGTPVYRGTRIPVHAIASMLAQGATVEELLSGYRLTEEQVRLAPVYAAAHEEEPPPPLPWADQKPVRVTIYEPSEHPNKA